MADRAEASRFTELRNYLEVQAIAVQQREAAAGTILAERFAQQQPASLDRIEQSDNALAAYMGQLEDRLERRGAVHDSLEKRLHPVAPGLAPSPSGGRLGWGLARHL